MRLRLPVLLLLIAVFVLVFAVPAVSGSVDVQLRMERLVRHELVMLPYYGVFDDLSFKVEGGKVTLLGQVMRPTLRGNAERAVLAIEGVETVDNQIEVLQPSQADDRIRIAVYRAIYHDDILYRYAHRAVPPIHIIVKGGHVRLEGVVGFHGDKSIASTRASAVPGVFSVTNNLRVER